MTQPPPGFFDPEQILNVFYAHGVRYVLVGGLAATLHGSPAVTYDVDVAAEQTPGNLKRLAGALGELGAVRYTDREGPLGEPGASRFTEDVEQFASPVGYIDVLRWIPVAGGYEQLVGRAEPIELGCVRVLVANLADIIASKEAAGRPKDHAQLPSLYALRDELARRQH